MSSTGYATPLRLEVSANPLLRRLFVLFLTAAILMLLLMMQQQPLLLFFVVPLLWVARREWLRRPELNGLPVSLTWDHQQRWWCHRGDDTHELSLLGDSYLSTNLVVLNFHQLPRRKGLSLVLTPRGIGSDTFRRLLVRLRIEGKEAVSGAQAQ